MLFRNRMHAGWLLANRLSGYADGPDLLVCALPRGGVLVGYPVASALHARLDVVIVRKLGIPGFQEVAMGAIASGGVSVLSRNLIDALGISSPVLDVVTEHEQRELARREELYRGEAPPLEIPGRTVILVDDGIATGSTMQAAAIFVRRQHPKRLVIAVPVAPPSICAQLASQADEVVALEKPEPFFAIGAFYEDFHQVSDKEVQDLLKRAAIRAPLRRSVAPAS
jgi:putative phosphoribosyl transferase